MGTSRLARRLLVLLPVIGCVLFAGVTMVAGAPTSAFELVFDGRHVPATIPTLSGVMHVGAFAGSAPFCASATVEDTEFKGSNAVIRSYTCSDRSGSMTMRVTPFESADEITGSWKARVGIAFECSDAWRLGNRGRGQICEFRVQRGHLCPPRQQPVNRLSVAIQSSFPPLPFVDMRRRSPPGF